ncbi:MAG TPA: hypothetical protein VF212_16685 [Longimicrobiales bacterium]
MDYPLSLSFKLIAVSPQLSVTDATGRTVFYVRQKAFKLKESVTVYADREQTRPVAQMSADRILDISATYRLQAPNGDEFGTVRRRGLKSFWKAHYDVLRQDTELMSLKENNAFVKLMDGILSQIPVLGLLSGYVFQPSYDLARADGTTVMRVKKRPAFLEGRFSIEKLGELPPEDEALAILSILMMVLLERTRG